MIYATLKGRFTINSDSEQIELNILGILSANIPISKNTHSDVIKRGISRDTKNHSHVIKQVKFLLIPNN